MLKTFIEKIIKEEKMPNKQRNLIIFDWLDNVLINKFKFEKGEPFGAIHFWIKNFPNNKKVIVNVYVSGKIPTEIEVYGQKLMGNKWKTFPEESQRKINLEKIEGSVKDVILFIKNKIENIFNLTREI